MSAPVSVRLFEPPALAPERPQRILLLKLDHIGDFFTALPAFRLIRTAFRKAEITLVCLPATVELAKSTGLFTHITPFSFISDSIAFDKITPEDVAKQTTAFSALMQGRYNLAADFVYDAAPRILLDHVDADWRAGFLFPIQKGLDIFLPKMEWDIVPSAIGGKNLPMHAELRLTLLAHAIIDSLQSQPLDATLFPIPEATETLRSLQSSPRPKIGVSLGAGSELRKWSPDNWVTLLNRLTRDHKALIVFLGSEADKAETQILTAQLTTDSYIDLTGATSLSSIPSYMKLLTAYIGCDTGLTHLAANLGIPTVNIFAGISNVSVWRARGPKVKTIYAEVICAPCHLRFKEDCPNNNICMKAIVPDIVYACLAQLLAP